MKKALIAAGVLAANSTMADVGVGYGISVPGSTTLESSYNYSLSWDPNRWVYTRVGYEKPNFTLAGQSIGNIELIGAEAGVKYDFSDRWTGYAGVGRWWTDENTNIRIQDEAVTTTLRNMHGEMPFWPTETRFSLGNDWGVVVGARFDLIGGVHLDFSHRFLQVPMGYDAYVAPFEFANNHWQDRVTKDLSSTQARLEYRF